MTHVISAPSIMILLTIQEKLAKLLEEHFGVVFTTCVFIVAAILTGLIWLTIWLYKVYHLKKDVEKLPCKEHALKLDRVVAVETKINSLPCSEHMEQIRNHTEGHTSVLSRLSSIDTTLIFLQKGVDGLNQSLQKGNKIITDSFTQSHSPLSITELGYKMIERMGIQEIFELNWSRINELIKSEAIGRNPYDIQQFCIQQAVVFPEKFISESELNKIKVDAYNTGNPLQSYMKVIAVMARDRYFKENDIDVSEVDANDPAK